eukprot:3588589-Rhodomonas_salina.16
MFEALDCLSTRRTSGPAQAARLMEISKEKGSEKGKTGVRTEIRGEEDRDGERERKECGVEMATGRVSGEESKCRSR